MQTVQSRTVPLDFWCISLAFYGHTFCERSQVSVLALNITTTQRNAKHNKHFFVVWFLCWKSASSHIFMCFYLRLFLSFYAFCCSRPSIVIVNSICEMCYLHLLAIQAFVCSALRLAHTYSSMNYIAILYYITPLEAAIYLQYAGTKQKNDTTSEMTRQHWISAEYTDTKNLTQKFTFHTFAWNIK